MLSNALKWQAIIFALCNGIVAFVLASWITLNFAMGSNPLGMAMAFGLALGVLSWGMASRLIDHFTKSATAAVSRLAQAAQGDLIGPVPSDVASALPDLSRSLDELFVQVRSSIENANSLALFDPVTSLPNRVHFRNETEAVIAALPENGRSALFFIDLDHFKAVNDTLGHAAGDQVLIMVANRMRELVTAATLKNRNARFSAIPGRLAGDEFTLFLPDCGTRKTAESMAKGLIAALNRPFMIAGQQVEIGASIGVAMRPDHGTSLTNLMRAADVAMYQAKAEGRGLARFYSNDLAAQLKAREKLDVDLHLALDRKEFGLVFQPQTDLRTGRLIAAECLLRWYHPVDGVRVPASFLAALEENGLMPELGDRTLVAIADAAATMRRHDPGVRMAANFSRREICQPGFAVRVMTALAAQGLTAASIEFEISADNAMKLSEAIMGELAQLRSGGGVITIDNFGRGAIAIGKLRGLPVDRVKLDPDLVRDIVHDPEARAIVQGLVGIVHGIGKQIVAQGVENSDQLEILRVMGVDAVQGYGIAHPMDEAQLLAWSWERPVRFQKRVR
jgi:diguanylate cyclase